jgi:hypothetical protein
MRFHELVEVIFLAKGTSVGVDSSPVDIATAAIIALLFHVVVTVIE